MVGMFYNRFKNNYDVEAMIYVIASLQDVGMTCAVKMD